MITQFVVTSRWFQLVLQLLLLCFYSYIVVMIISEYLFLAPQQDVFVNLDGKFYLGNYIIAAASIAGRMNNALGVPCLGWSLVSYEF